MTVRCCPTCGDAHDGPDAWCGRCVIHAGDEDEVSA